MAPSVTHVSDGLSEYQCAIKAWKLGSEASGRTMRESLRFTPAHKKRPEHIAALEALRGWTRAQFSLSVEGSVLVAEVACGLPGCPPLETVVAFWNEAGERHQFKIFKPVEEVGPDDLPPRWMKNALVVDTESGFACC